MNIHQNDDRRAWYLDVGADDERIDAALESIRTPLTDDSPTHAESASEAGDCRNPNLISARSSTLIATDESAIIHDSQYLPVDGSSCEDGLGSILEVDVHVPVTIRLEHTGKLAIPVGDSKAEGGTILVEVSDFADTADAVEGRHLLNNRHNLLVQLIDWKNISRLGRVNSIGYS